MCIRDRDNRMYSYFNIADNQYLTYELAQEAASQIPAETHFVTLRLGTDGAQSWKAKLDYLSPNVTLTTGCLLYTSRIVQVILEFRYIGIKVCHNF